MKLYPIDEIKNIVKENTLKESMKILNCSYSAIYRFKQKYHLQSKKSKYKTEKTQLVIELITLGLTDKEISVKAKCTRQYVNVVRKSM